MIASRPAVLLLAAIGGMLVLPVEADAARWAARQGEVVAVTHASVAPPELYALGRRWPVRPAGDGRWRGWIGVDLAQAPGVYGIEWRTGTSVARDRLVVSRGAFRVSRITVPARMARFDAETLARIRREAQRVRACYRDAGRGLRPPAIAFARLPLAGAVVSTPFGARRIVNGEPRAAHAGVDLAAPAGTPVVAPAAGRVALVLDGYLIGKTICLVHGEGWTSVYMHLRRVTVREGDRVEAGALLGEVGATGRATGPHLHWGAHFGGARVDPLTLVALPPAAARR